MLKGKKDSEVSMRTNIFRLYSLILLLSVLVTADVVGQEKSVAHEVEQEKIETVQPSLASDFVVMMDALRTEAPAVYERVNSMPREDALLKIMTALDTGVVKADGEKSASKTERKKNVKPSKYNSLRLTNKKIPYFRIENLTREQAFQIVSELAILQQEKPEGIILDIREAVDGEYESCVSLANTFADVKSRLVILMSAETGGMPSLLPSILKKKNVRMSILGMPSYTPIFPTHSIRIAGTVWKFPLIAEEYKDLSPYPLMPDLRKVALPCIDYLQLKSHPNDLGLDPLLRLATDLLVLNSAMKL